MGKWINTSGPWLGGITDKPQPVIKEEPITEKGGDDKFGIASIFVRPRCPKCGNKKKLICTKVDGEMRYYKCPCGNKFKAIEKDAQNS